MRRNNEVQYIELFRIVHCSCPIETPDLLSQWLAKLNLRNWQPTKNSIICSDHFIQENFYRTSQTVRLLANAVPTVIYIAYSESQSAIPASTAIAPLISCDNDNNSTADDNIPQTYETQLIEESASDVNDMLQR